MEQPVHDLGEEFSRRVTRPALARSESARQAASPAIDLTPRRAARVLALASAVAIPGLASCGSSNSSIPPSASPVVAETGPRAQERQRMVELQLAERGITDSAVLAAMKRVPRHEFVPANVADEAYEDCPLPIGHGQTISQPYVVAFMTQAAEVRPGDKVLEVGTGSGYQAAVLSEIVGELWSLEILAPLAERARTALAVAGYDRVHVRTGDGYRGWPEEAPFDAILLTAAPDHVPEPLLEQLAPGGRLVLPVGSEQQSIELYRRTPEGFVRESLLPVRFVPMTGEAQEQR